jgi:hypothetical protein
MTSITLIGLMVVIAVATQFRAADAISCYTTTSGTQTGCAFCQKTVSSVANLANVVTKECVPVCTGSSSTGIAGLSNNVYCCSTDLCNGAVTARISVLGALGAALLALWAMRR